jgi:hypothetical protein
MLLNAFHRCRIVRISVLPVNLSRVRRGGDRRTSGGRNILDREKFKLKNLKVEFNCCFFDFSF